MKAHSRPVDCIEHHDGGPTIVVGWIKDGAMDALVDALELFWPILRPLTAEVRVACYDMDLDWPDQDKRPIEEFHFVHDGTDLELGAELDVLHPIYQVPRIVAVRSLSPDAVRELLRSSADQPSPSPGTHEVRWSELWMEATATRVPDGALPPAARSIRVQASERPGGVITVPLAPRDHSCWVLAPTQEMREHLVKPPLTLRATEQGGINVSVRAAWSIWTEHDAPGRRELLDVIDTLLQRGWLLRHAGWAFTDIAGRNPSDTS